MNFQNQEKLALAIVFVAVGSLWIRFYRKYFGEWIATWFLKRGKVKIAMWLRPKKGPGCSC